MDFFKNYYKKFALQLSKGYRFVQHFAPKPRLCRFSIGFHIVNAVALLLQEGNTSIFDQLDELFIVVFEKNRFDEKDMKVMCSVLPEKMV